MDAFFSLFLQKMYTFDVNFNFIYNTTTNKFSCLLKPKKPHFTATKYSFLMAIEEKKGVKFI